MDTKIHNTHDDACALLYVMYRLVVQERKPKLFSISLPDRFYRVLLQHFAQFFLRGHVDVPKIGPTLFH